MNTTLYYDCFSGISGDMHIGALVDLGVPEDYLHGELAKLSVAGEFTLRLERARKMGITGTKATVSLHTDEATPVRHLSEVEAIILSAGYSPGVTELASGIFQEIALAEAKIHGTTVDKVHFHEVGATDSIVDIIAAAICLDWMAPDRIVCGTVELGGGMVRCAHGVMPVPAPATAEILSGVPCHYGRVEMETTTPTGAAILKRAVDNFSVPNHFVSKKIGYGIGQKDFSIPNVLRVMLGETSDALEAGPYESAANLEIECNIDDMPAEAFQPLLEGLLANGAKDVFLTPTLMKKSRPGTKVTVLCARDELDVLSEFLFNNSTTIGVRIHEVQKRMLPRTIEKLTTRYGDVRVKIASLPSGQRKWKVEHDDILQLAGESEIEYLELKRLIDLEIGAKIELTNDKTADLEHE
ncbi:MAG: nickel pincer cofactor biosynthesis protein LarC [Gammaproteobacteria bacterium]|nr:nickel pincer cofactor biosynthesis protein LarC [Gammaproteobacteria bacterium]